MICKLTIDENGIVKPELTLDSRRHTQQEIDAAVMRIESRRMNEEEVKQAFYEEEEYRVCRGDKVEEVKGS